jgi:protein-S-isoprenylcysteine O-methyltransferase Ste14
MRVLGLVLMLPALLLLTIAPQATQLVTHGIYSRIRDPIYVFGTFVFSGLFLFLERPLLLFFLVPC